MSSKALLQSLYYPSEIAALLKFKLTVADPTSDLTKPEAVSPSDPTYADYTRRLCYYFLNLTSRSFARVIQELDEELRHPICLFYLILRGLDTVEDDMTIPIARKVDVLESFHRSLHVNGWTFKENGPNEKDAPLLREFDCVIAEFGRLDPKCACFRSSKSVLNFYLDTKK
jgi:farnesyl-diphosphate farnesyltransferase